MVSSSNKDNVPYGYGGELYTSRLFDMRILGNGRNMPDLISRNGHFIPVLLLEIKSGTDRRASLNEFQLHYSVRSQEDYSRILGQFPAAQDIPFGDPSTTYYDCLERSDNITQKDLRHHFSHLRLEFRDHYIVPGEYTFYTFAVARSRRTGEAIPETVCLLREIIIASLTRGYMGNKYTQARQNIHMTDIEAIFKEDLTLTNTQGVKRIKGLSEIYPAIYSLRRVHIPGPNRTSIHILARPEHERLFDVQLRQNIQKEVHGLEEIIEKRKKAAELVRRIQMPDQTDLFEKVPAPKVNSREELINPKDRNRFKRLELWLPE